ncbi:MULTISPECIES: polyphosphate polymerase domain-containing protein [unclassified Streptococcus]|uniref:polyphosphate polymerase domain-containing protein n=1 Tax=unclassified Streptococcus TaxID=2608887 RepID=UPI001071D71F|nr:MULTISPECIES: polyphosphate polymerase domain-containing protein [unclassified Streptococcus]MBF0786560.1 polyphosphate polymerase domain-containing protein [Streptococcus sp. 19428wC2_LYSM12]MCQ9210947.1 polyphosphate polymerase domain-containing protein [Streptococcus sp. B01]MCQ9214216.1 polyphosphate polymerase domain-containing protein [Streptococcus sp. O1]TFV06524.1 polyphosphate polymerase domain-containing protein [Streptococcus sp. LYSM12]
MKTKIVQKQFRRKESKYIVDKKVFVQLEAELKEHMVADDYAKSSITNIYFDNDNFGMIQDAIAKKYGREKVRMRIYDTEPSENSQAFLEIKQKENKIGLKYRLTSTPLAVMNYVEKGLADHTITDEKVTSKLEVLRERYGTIKPKMYIYYDRVSFKGKEDRKIRVTVDQNLLYRDDYVDVKKGKFGRYLLDPDKVIMEIKVPEKHPAWLIALLEKYQIDKQSFSKYGNAYRLAQTSRGGEPYANAVI